MPQEIETVFIYTIFIHKEDQPRFGAIKVLLENKLYRYTDEEIKQVSIKWISSFEKIPSSDISHGTVKIKQEGKEIKITL